MSHIHATLDRNTGHWLRNPAHRLHTKLGFYEGTFVVGDIRGAVHDGAPLPYQADQCKCNASAELTADGLTIVPAFGTPLSIEPAQLRGVIVNSKGTSKSSWGCERVLNMLWENDGNYLCTVLAVMYLSKSFPREWKKALDSLARQANSPEAPEPIRERVRMGFFDHKRLNALMGYIFLAVIGIQVSVWATIFAVQALAL